MNRSAEEFQQLYTSQLEFASRLKDLASGEGAHQKDRAKTVVDKTTTDFANSCEGSVDDQDSQRGLSNVRVRDLSSPSEVEDAAVDIIIPKSFEEIYSLSLKNKNRSQKGKDKKRVRDGESGGNTAGSFDKSDGTAPLLHDGCEDPSSQASIDTAAVDRSIDSMYKVNASDEKVDIGVDETVSNVAFTVVRHTLRSYRNAQPYSYYLSAASIRRLCWLVGQRGRGRVTEGFAPTGPALPADRGVGGGAPIWVLWQRPSDPQ